MRVQARRGPAAEPVVRWAGVITQCSIQPGASFAYRVILSQEEGTLWRHAHTGFDRATVHGAIVIHPSRGTTFPFQFHKIRASRSCRLSSSVCTYLVGDRPGHD
jgi:hypothetical protein